MIPHTTTLQATVERSRLHTFLLCCGIIGSALFAIVNFSFSAISANYDIARQPVGDLEIGKYGWIQSANFIVAGIFLCAFALGLRREMVKGPGAISIPALQIFLGLAMLLLGIFTHRIIHTPMIFVLFVSILGSFFIFSRRFAMDKRWEHWSVYTNITGIILLIFFALYMRSNLHHGAYTGIYQRGVLLTRVIWNLFFTVRLLAGVRLDPVTE
jgi:hypothetical protein